MSNKSDEKQKVAHEKEAGASPEWEEITSASEIAPLSAKELVREEAAKTIAMLLVGGFLVLLSLPFVSLFVHGASVAEVVDMIKTIAAVLSGMIGAVLGYYFRIVQE